MTDPAARDIGAWKVHAYYEFGDLPLGEDEAAKVPDLDSLLSEFGIRIVQAYNDDAGYYLVEPLGDVTTDREISDRADLRKAASEIMKELREAEETARSGL